MTDHERAAREAEIAGLQRALLLAAILTLPVFVLEMGSHFIPAVHDWVMGTLGHRTSWYLQFALTTLVLFGPGLRFFRKGIPALLRRCAGHELAGRARHRRGLCLFGRGDLPARRCCRPARTTSITRPPR